MNIVCVICSDLLAPSDDVFYTPCGHIFHFVCLSQWLERSKSCPQCREKATLSKIHRVYFNFSNNDTIVEDSSSLQDKVDNLKFQILIKDKEIKQYIEKNETLQKQNVGQKKEIRKVESELMEKTSAIHAMKEQVKFFKEQCSEIVNAREQIARLKQKVEEYKNIQILLNAPIEDMDEMISKTLDPSTLITYISVMKREMTISLNKRREMRSKMKSLQQELTKVSMERNFLSDEHEKRKKLEEQLMIRESEVMSLQNMLRDLNKNGSSNIKSYKCNSINTDQVYEPINNAIKTISEDKESNNLIDDAKIKTVENMKKQDNESEENSPYLRVKSQSVFALEQQSTQLRPAGKSSLSILSKRPRIEQRKGLNRPVEANTITYNGFGGHSKYDRFPSPITGLKTKKIKDDEIKAKKQKFDTGNTNISESQATFYPPSLMPPFMGAYPPTKLGGSLYDGGSISYFQNYRNETLSKFSMPPYEWGLQSTPYSPKPDIVAASKLRDLNRSLSVPVNDIATIDRGRMKEVDDLFKGVQIHRKQYKDRDGRLHPLAFFKSEKYNYQCAPGMTTSYLSKYRLNFVEYKAPPVLPVTYKRRSQIPYIPELSLSGTYNRSSCIAYKR